MAFQFSGRLIAPPPFTYADAPQRHGIESEPVTIASPRTAGSLDGWLLSPSRSGSRAVLFLHGWGSDKQHMMGEYLAWLARRYTVLAFDHPGHGDSPPGPVTLGDREREDAAAALAWLKARGYTRVGVLGTSMGGTTAIGLAAAQPEVRAVVSDATYATLAEVPAGYMRAHGYPFPDALARLTVAMTGWRTGRDLGAADAERAIGRIAPRPVLLIHGTADHVILPDNGTRLLAAARAPKALWRVDGADHLSEPGRGPHAVAPAAYERRVLEFFDQWL